MIFSTCLSEETYFTQFINGDFSLAKNKLIRLGLLALLQEVEKNHSHKKEQVEQDREINVLLVDIKEENVSDLSPEIFLLQFLTKRKLWP
jgi:hypothetical protein